MENFEKHINVLAQSALFKGLTCADLAAQLSCLDARYASYEKECFLCRRGEAINRMGMVLSGQVHMIKEDFWGNRTIVGMAQAGELFAETYACLPAAPLEVSVFTPSGCEVLWLDGRKVLRSCDQACAYHARMIENLLLVLANKNLNLTRRVDQLARRTTREKVLAFLSAEAQRSASASFTISFDRQQLADYLCVDRSALSSTLGGLQREGLLQFRKNHFILADAHEE